METLTASVILIGCLVGAPAALGNSGDPPGEDAQAVGLLGSLVAWGGQGYWDKGQTQVPAGNDYTAVAAGMFHCLAVRADGSIVAWGGNDDRQCDVPNGHDYVAIAAGFRHSLALRRDGTLVAWGRNSDGQCNVPAGSDYLSIAAGANHCLALKTNGTVVAWGDNGSGQCGVPRLVACRAISAGVTYSLALTTDGSLVAWGGNWNGETNVPAGTDFVAISSGDHHSIAQRADGSLVAWGLTRDGRCDLPAGTEHRRGFCAGGHHNLVLRSDGSLMAWGDCSSGQCESPGGTDYIAIAAGTHHNVAIRYVESTTRQGKIAIDYATVGHPGNPDDTHEDPLGNRYGSVSYVYRIGKFEVTAAQYCTFLNAVAADDPYGLYDAGCRIQRYGAPGSYTYSVAYQWAHRPVNFVNFWDACRFANWLHNSQPVGAQDPNTTEDGAYTLNGHTGPGGRDIIRNPHARVWIPSADEWYKAAYHKNDGITNHYWDYPTCSDHRPSNDLKDPDPGNSANFAIGHPADYTVGPPYWRTPVGSFENSSSPYGTYDQAGNIREWTDSFMEPEAPYRTQHGSSFDEDMTNRADQMGWHSWGPQVGNSIVGFRVAARLKSDFSGVDGQPDDNVDFVDFAALGLAWDASAGDDHWDSRCDISQDGGIGPLDVYLFCASWLGGLVGE